MVEQSGGHPQCPHEWTEWVYDAVASARSGVGTAESRYCLLCDKKEVD